MRQTTQEHKLPEVLVFGNEYPIFLRGERQHRIIRCVRQTIMNRQNIAAKVSKRCKDRC